MAIEDWLQGNKGLGSLLPGKGGERMKPLPPGFKRERFLQQPPPRPRIEEPGGPRPPRPPGVSLAALKRKRQQLREQLRQIEAQIRSLGSGRRWDEFDFGPEPPMPVLPRPPRGIPIGPPTMPVPTIPIGPERPSDWIPELPTKPVPPPWRG
jgi:hypothetical protein